MELVQLTAQQLNDYRTGMQRNAAAFIERHQQEHLQDDSLFDRTVNHLVNVWGVPVFMADRLVHLAMTERLPKGSRWIGIDLASGPDTCILHDFRIGKSIPVPLRYLPYRFQAQFLDQLGTQLVALPAH
ncbi:hypothetical protein NUV66_16190 [Pseudomonas sp. 32.2.56]|uniref:hypothetical protein n=1 Tax=Pseudomonas sp. 32.2.56 TaxID=2969303 RepID=UPI00214F655F|nr:hypothetical protein [Pseudomonas sp. 32.2.56]MCR4510850.1 hypothetical protein [Pseudomonas sp. 32.2.56]